MKLIFTITTAILFSFSVSGYASSGMLSISSRSNDVVTVSIDNRIVNQNNSREWLIHDIDAGYHVIKVYSNNHSRWQSNKKLLIYSSHVFIRAGYHTDIIINRFGNAFIDERRMGANYYDDEDLNCYDDGTFYRSMDAASFNQFKQTIVNGSFESTKIAIAKQTISQNYFTASQIKEIVLLFSFDTNKMDIAKHAFKYCLDKNNYFIVNDALDFSSSKEELARYVERSR